MINIVPTLQTDLPQIADWVRQDPFHCDDETWENVEGMLTGNGLLCFKLQDDIGPLVFVRLDVEGELVRITMQFASSDEVSKRRLIVGLIKLGIPTMKALAEKKGYKGLVFRSISDSLIRFGNKQGFKAIGNDDYAMVFEEKNNVQH